MAFNGSVNQIATNWTSSAKTSSGAISSSTAGEIIPLESRPPIMAIIISLYALIFFFGITGNALVVCKHYIFLNFNLIEIISCL
jgi:hypothetical protein